MTQKNIARIVTVVVIVAMIVAFRYLPIGEWLVSVEAWARANPVAGALAYLALSIIAIVATTPGWIPMMLAGLIFDFWPGVLYALLAIVLGATAALWAGRTLARDWVAKRIADNPRMLALDDALAEKALMIVALTRLAFVLPFNLLNYVYGLTRVRIPIYMLGTAIGMFPIVAMYVYLGTLTQNMGQILDGDLDIAANSVWFIGIGAVAIVTIIVIVKRAVGRALDARMRESGGT